MTKRLLSVQEVADDLRVTTETVRNLIRRGELDGVRVGRLWRVTKASVQRLEEGDRRSQWPPQTTHGV